MKFGPKVRKFDQEIYKSSNDQAQKIPEDNLKNESKPATDNKEILEVVSMDEVKTEPIKNVEEPIVETPKEEKPKKTTRKPRVTKAKDPVVKEPKKPTKKKTTKKSDASLGKLSAGDRDCYCYFSIKATTTYHDADIISVAMVSPDGDTLYLVNSDLAIEKINKELAEKYLSELKAPTENHLTGHTWIGKCGREEMRDTILTWLNDHYSSKGKLVQFCTDKINYEFMLLKELLIEQLDEFMKYKLSFSQYCMDLNSEIGTIISLTTPRIGEENFVPTYIASTVDRLQLYNNVLSILDNEYKLKDYSLLQLITFGSNSLDNALFNAIVIRVIHQDLLMIRK